MRRLVCAFALFGLAGLSQAQVRCAMPNGVLITQQLGGCPRDAIQVDALPDAQAAPAAVQVVKPVAAPVILPAPVSKSGAAQVVVDDDGGMSGLEWMAVVLLAAGLFFAVKGSVGVSGRSMFCTSCGHEGPGKTVTRGSILIEIVLWLCFLVPGLIYSIWRQVSKHKACSRCGAQTLIAPDSPVAAAMKRALAQSNV